MSAQLFKLLGYPLTEQIISITAEKTQAFFFLNKI